MSKKPLVWIRLREEERELLKEIAYRYDISESDVVKIALIEFARNHGIEV
ncbi:CopG family transcriptional regulator [Acidianus ambivalens]|uniref:CopG family transcriptional regulator n=1 Tax=Acidianus ambivalens TaxID=2283 RepID=A0A6G1T7K8_ACIAM|nr:CopG family transcriptional regulator [Acidianus ambivalens]